MLFTLLKNNKVNDFLLKKIPLYKSMPRFHNMVTIK